MNTEKVCSKQRLYSSPGPPFSQKAVALAPPPGPLTLAAVFLVACQFISHQTEVPIFGLPVVARHVQL